MIKRHSHSSWINDIHLPDRVTHTIPLIGQAQAFLSMPQPITLENLEQIRRWLDFMAEALTTPSEVPDDR